MRRSSTPSGIVLRLSYHRQLRALLEAGKDPVPLWREYIGFLNQSQSHQDARLAAIHEWLCDLFDESARERDAPFGPWSQFQNCPASQSEVRNLVGGHIFRHIERGTSKSGSAISAENWRTLNRAEAKLSRSNVLWEQALGILIRRYRAKLDISGGLVALRWRSNIQQGPHEFDGLIEIQGAELAEPYTACLLQLDIEPPVVADCDEREPPSDSIVAFCPANQNIKIDLMTNDDEPLEPGVPIDKRLEPGDRFPFQVRLIFEENPTPSVVSAFYETSHSLSGEEQCFWIAVKARYLDDTGPNWTEEPLRILMKRGEPMPEDHSPHPWLRDIKPTWFAIRYMEDCLGIEPLMEAFCRCVRSEGRSHCPDNRLTQASVKEIIASFQELDERDHPLWLPLNDWMRELPSDLHRRVVLAFCALTYPAWGADSWEPSTPEPLNANAVWRHRLLEVQSHDPQVLVDLEQSGFLKRRWSSDRWVIRIWIGHIMPYRWFIDQISILD